MNLLTLEKDLSKNFSAEMEIIKIGSWDRCNDFLKFAEKFGEKIGVIDSKQS
jgi:hypothetical protein